MERNPGLNAAKNWAARIRASRILFYVNLAILSVLLLLLRGAVFSPPWDGAAVVTVALTVATIVLAAVGLGVGLLAVWGYTTLREYAANVAKVAAEIAADKAADRKVQALLVEWGLSGEGDDGEEVAKAYERE